MPDQAPSHTLVWVGVLACLVPQVVRATTNSVLVPHWDMDPSLVEGMAVGLLPSGSMLIDAISLLGASLLIGIGLATSDSRERIILGAMLALATLGALGVIWHGWISEAQSIGHRRIGSAWVSGIYTAVGLASAARDRDVARVVLSALLGLALLLLLRGVYQLYVEHPATLAEFRRTRDTIFAANGWTPDSAAALAYERRISQAETTGWFALSNVFGSFMAAAATAACATACVSIGSFLRLPAPRGSDRGAANARHHARWRLGILGALAGMTLTGTVLSGSRGALGAFSLATAGCLAALVLRARVRDEARAAMVRLLGPLLIAMTLTAVVARGMFGERLGELSLLFRWYYLQGAARIFADHPLGVGPDGFKEAYLLAKNPLNPEEVQSPHSVFFDWLACLGVFGVAWIALLIWCAVRTGPALSPGVTPPPHDAWTAGSSERAVLRVALLTAALALLGAVLVESQAIAPGMAAIRLIGLAGWAGLAALFLWVTRDRTDFARVGLAGAALALLVHAQIEVTMSWSSSCGLALAAVGAAARGGDCRPHHRASVGKGRALILLSSAGLPALLAVGVLVAGVLPARAWEARLARAAVAVEALPQVEQLMSRIVTAADPATSAQARAEAAEYLTRLSGRRVSPDWNDLRAAALQERSVRARRAAEHLLRAEGRIGQDFEARRSAVRMLAHAAAAEVASGRPDLARSTLTEAAMVFGGMPESPADVDALSLLPALQMAAVYRERAALSSPHDPADLRRAARLTERAVQLDPYSLEHQRSLLALWTALDEPERALAAARRLLELDDLVRLDREVKGLSPMERTRVEEQVRTLNLKVRNRAD
jgi:tetratricopeptide (TPR) repeat protein